MKRFTVAVARERLSDALNAADANVPVIIERRGVEYRLTRMAARDRSRAVRSSRIFSKVDPAILTADWSWEWKPGGVRLVTRRSS